MLWHTALALSTSTIILSVNAQVFPPYDGQSNKCVCQAAPRRSASQHNSSSVAAYSGQLGAKMGAVLKFGLVVGTSWHPYCVQSGASSPCRLRSVLTLSCTSRCGRWNSAPCLLKDATKLVFLQFCRWHQHCGHAAECAERLEPHFFATPLRVQQRQSVQLERRVGAIHGPRHDQNVWTHAV